ncbi:hypothetical protein [Sulfuricurvum sp.]|uniref:hypothetical protein n=1 Tax=Sulfuricurvum sp. TaxID=2025608 RepID=UPI003567CF19
MLDILREAQGRFKEIHTLLNNNEPQSGEYFERLNESTQNAYVLMNEGMCANTTVCHQCAEHRDFLHSMIGMLEDLELGTPISSIYREKLQSYNAKVTEILTKISDVLSSF